MLWFLLGVFSIDRDEVGWWASQRIGQFSFDRHGCCQDQVGQFHLLPYFEPIPLDHFVDQGACCPPDEKGTQAYFRGSGQRFLEPKSGHNIRGALAPLVRLL